MTSATAGPLARARDALEKGDDESALAALLEAWREERHVRVADVIDHLSERISTARGPIEAKSVKARTAQWLEIAARKDPADVGRLLATKWPGKWKDAMPVIQALVAFPPDPRIAIALARVVEATPYDSWTSVAFYRPLFACVHKAPDARALPILERDLEREKSSYWRRRTRPLVEGAVAELKKAAAEVTPLDSEQDAVLAQIEARFSSVAGEKKTSAKTEAELLAAIYEAPDDDGPRAVYADWLSEKGEPRGELISLQLARATGADADVAAMRKREKTLLNKHGKAWSGPLDPFLEREGRVFERGFLAEAVLSFQARSPEPPKALLDPAWATVHTLGFSFHVTFERGLTEAILALPSMKWLRAIRGIEEHHVAMLTKAGPRARLEELDFSVSRADARTLDERAADRRVIASGAAFPNVRRIAIEADLDDAEARDIVAGLLSGALAKRLERVTILHYSHPIGRAARFVEALGIGVPEVAVGQTRHTVASGWSIVAARDDAGRYTKLRCAAPDGTKALPSPATLSQVLRALEPGDVTELVVEAADRIQYDEREILELETAIARFERLSRLDVPWPRLERRDDRDEGRCALWLYGGGLGAPSELETWWRLVSEPPVALSFDAFEVNQKGHKPLPADGLAHASSLLEKKRTTSLKLYRTGSADTRYLQLMRHHAGLGIAGTSHETTAEDVLSWLTRALDALPIERGYALFVTNRQGTWTTHHDQGHLQPLDFAGSWLQIFGPAEGQRISFDALAAIAGGPGLERLRVARSKRHLVLAFGPTPHELATAEERLAFEIASARVLWKSYEERLGFVPHELAREVLTPRFEALGFEAVPLSPREEALGRLHWMARPASGARAIVLTPILPMRELRFTLRVLHMPGDPDADTIHDPARTHWVDDEEAHTHELARTGLETLATKVEVEAMPFFENVKKKR